MSLERIEKDGLGTLKIPGDKRWGIHTQRALRNFGQSPFLKMPPALIRAYARVKLAACLANVELGYLDPLKGKAIRSACEKLAAEARDEDFPLDPLQGGAGTSTNMNVNEVIASLAAAELGVSGGDPSSVDPIEHVNLHQSTNDTYPTALKIALIFELRRLSAEIEKLQGVLQSKEKEFSGIVKIGRTEMQEAVPMTLGAEFSAFAEALARDRWRTFKCEERLRFVNLGGTAVGTGLGAPRKYIFLVAEKLREVTGLGLSRGENGVDQTANQDALAEVSGMLRAHASNLAKMADDLRLLNLLGEIGLPKLQTGSSIMPGKTNPVMLEAALQISWKVMANDLLVGQAVSRGSLQINEFLPLVAYAMLESLGLMAGMDGRLAVHLQSLQASREVCLGYLEKSETLITAFLPDLGYRKAEEFLNEFRSLSGRTLRSFLEEKLGKDKVDKTLAASSLLSLGYGDD